ncbi:hypothetical protein DAPPUDRAFT_234061 [Daphnia pulex]|uniref:Uncharacterized protein n=1 Tax=Daphnia pulex TaxID=6669 RepID=E9FUH0_DAPPU|nr:hypothetical protein DAPPUDRAFT_234061 [Daphnia pulex]|eukprot:EFX88727.1 hypothetical protein DAPPUDRAFT_234061 [Daphnia pulex]
MGKQFLIGYNRDLMHRNDLTGSQHIATHSVHTDGTRVIPKNLELTKMEIFPFEILLLQSKLPLMKGNRTRQKSPRDKADSKRL